MKRDRLQEAFLSGMGSTIVLIPPPMKVRIPPLTKPTFHRNDREALQADWEAVGQEIRKAMNIVSEEINEQSEESKTSESSE